MRLICMLYARDYIGVEGPSGIPRTPNQSPFTILRCLAWAIFDLNLSTLFRAFLLFVQALAGARFARSKKRSPTRDFSDSRTRSGAPAPTASGRGSRPRQKRRLAVQVRSPAAIPARFAPPPLQGRRPGVIPARGEAKRSPGCQTPTMPRDSSATWVEGLWIENKSLWKRVDEIIANVLQAISAACRHNLFLSCSCGSSLQARVAITAQAIQLAILHSSTSQRSKGTIRRQAAHTMETVRPEDVQKFLALTDRHELAAFLDISHKKLTYHAYAVAESLKYTKFSIPKRPAGIREISAPITSLRIIHKKLATMFTAIYKAKPCVHGFVPGKSILTNAKAHNRARHILNFDLKDFFPSIHFGRILGLLLKPPFSLKEEVAKTIAHICCFERRLPQGASTSPILSNFICRRLDRELVMFCGANRCTYTRYADDITISTNLVQFPKQVAVRESDVVLLGEKLLSIIAANSFQINEKKTRMCSNNERKAVTGLTVNEFPNVSRRFIRRIRAMLHAWAKFGFDAANVEFREKYDRKHRNPFFEPPEISRVVDGMLNYVSMVRGADCDIYLNFRRKYEKLMRQTAVRSAKSIKVTPSKKAGDVPPIAQNELPTYNQEVKIKVRNAVLTHAIEQLTASRLSSPLVTRQDFLAAADMVIKRIKKSRKKGDASTVEAEVLSWIDRYDTYVNKKAAKDLRVLYLCGPEPLNDLDVLLNHGIKVENVWAVEEDKRYFRAAENAITKSLYKKIKLYHGKLHSLLSDRNETFDIIYFDGCSALLEKPSIEVLTSISNSRLSPLSALVTNFSFAQPTDDKRMCWNYRLAAWYVDRAREPKRYEKDVFEGDQVATEYLAHVNENLESYYDEFTTEFMIEFFGRLQPWRKVPDHPDYRIFGSEEEVKAALDWLSNAKIGALLRNCDGSDCPIVFPYFHLTRLAQTLERLKNDKLNNLLLARTQYLPFGKAVNLVSIARNCHCDESIAAGIPSNILSEGMETAIRDVDWVELKGDFNKTKKCSRAIVDMLIGHHGFPYHVNMEKIKRIRYVAKHTPMYSDVLILDQARYFYDTVPNILEMKGGITLGSQIVARICMDLISRHTSFGSGSMFDAPHVLRRRKPLTIPTRSEILADPRVMNKQLY